MTLRQYRPHMRPLAHFLTDHSARPDISPVRFSKAACKEAGPISMARKHQNYVPTGGVIYYFDIVHDHPEIGGVVEFSKTLYRQLRAHYGDRFVSARDTLSDRGFSGAGMSYLNHERRAAELLAAADPDSTFFFPNFQSPIARTQSDLGPRIINVIHDVQFAFLPELFEREHLDWLHAAFAGTRANADHVVFISQTTRAQYIERFGEPRSHSVIYNPVDINNAPTIEPGSRAPFLLTVAHRHAHKNFSGLLALFSELARFRPDLELRIAGHGIDRITSDLDALPASIRRRVHHHGFVQRDVRDALYRQANAFVTLSRFEGFNMAAAEAASHGTPLILSDLPVHRELHAGRACLLDLTISPAEQAERASAYLTTSLGRTVEPWRHVVDCDPAVVGQNYARVIDSYGADCRPVRSTWSDASQGLAGGQTRSSFRAVLATSTAIIVLSGALAISPTLALAGGGDGGDAMPSFQGGAGGDGYQGEAGGDAETSGGGGYPGGGGGAAGGGAGGAGFHNGGDGGAGGTHGRQIDSGSSDTLGSPGDLIGADGEAGQDVQDGSQFGAGGGGGGAGGYGVIVSGTGQLTSEDRSIAGGNGGDGGASSSTYYAGGAGGGDGGIGVFFPGPDANFTVTSQTTVTGGDGGIGRNGVSGGYDEGDGGDGGAGGAGIQALDGGAIFIIEGGAVVAGGNGSAGGDGAAQDTVDGADGVGGVGVWIGGNGSTLISAGSISGGAGGDGVTRANAVEMIGDDNRLELRNGYGFTGDVVASGNNNALILGGAANSVFDASAVGAGAQYQGFDSFHKTGTSTWTLTGTGAEDWLIDNGTLAGDTDSFGGDLTFGTGAGTRGVVFDQASNGTYSGVISGDGSLVKTGSGTLTLNGVNTFAGLTMIEGGTLVVGDDNHATASLASAVTVLGEGTLGGIGTVGDLTVASGGTIAPGNSIGTLNVAGDVTFAAGSIYAVEVDPEGTESDLIDATGLATLNGGSVVHIGMGGSYDPTSTYTILTADGGVRGTFADVSSDFAFLDPMLSYDPNSVYLELVRNDIDFCMAGMSVNQCATGEGAESTGFGSEVYAAIVGLDEASARAAFDQLSGEVYASAQTALIEDSRFIRNAANDRIRSAFGEAGASYAPVLAYGPGDTPMAVAADHEGPVVWSHGFGSWGSTDSDGNGADLDRSSGGVLVGTDTLVGDWRVGVLAGYSHSRFDVDERASSGSSDTYHLGLYGGTQWGNVALRTGLAYSWHDMETNRSVTIPGFSDSASANYHAGTFQAFGELGYGLELATGTRLEPFANLAHVRLNTDGFTEEGGTAALSVESGATDVTFTTLGLRGEHAMALDTIEATLRGMVGWRHAFGDVTPESTHAFSAGNGFTIAGVPIARDAVVIEAGIDLTLTPQATFGLSYTGQIAADTHDHGFKANLSVNF